VSYPTPTFELDLGDNPIASYAEATLALGASLYYRLDVASTTYPDSSGNGFTGSLGGGGGGLGTVTGALTGDTDLASSFGSPNYVFVTPGPTLPTAGHTVEAWIKRNATGARAVIFSNYGAYLYVDTDDKLKARTAGISGTLRCTSTTTVDTAWHHVAYVFDGTDPHLYIDGVAVGTIAGSGLMGGAGNVFVGVGSVVGGTSDGNFCPAFLDEVAVYPTALGAAEVLAHYQTAATRVPLVWTDVSTYFIAGNTKRGRQHELDTIDAAEGTVVADDTDRALDPTNAAGPHFGQLLPMVRARLKWTYSAVTYTRFSGHVERFGLVWEMPSEARAEIGLVDGFELLAQADISDQVWGAESAGARINHALDAALWPRSLRNIDTGTATIAASAFDPTSFTSALRHIQDVSDGDLGYFFISGDGLATYHDRYHRGRATLSTVSQATFGDGAGQLPYEDLTPDYSKDHILNDVSTTASGSVLPQRVQDGTSIARYFRRSTQRNALTSTDADAALQSKLILATHKDPGLRIEAIVLSPSAISGTDGDNLWAQVLGREIGDRVTIVKTPPGGGAAISQDCYIEAMQDTFDGLDWVATWQLTPVSAGIQSWILDDAVWSVLDTTTVLA
jgi:hypothetical protein